MDRRDWLITVLGLILWGFTLVVAHNMGVEAGYWEHEEEENIYGCQVLSAGLDTVK